MYFLPESFLPDGDGLSTSSLVFMTFVYGYIILRAAERIDEGSEMLLTLVGPGIVGGLLIPIMRAIPEGMIILSSGLKGGSEEELMSHLEVGLGTLAGSTICLLTWPWAAVIILGRRDLDPETGRAQSKMVNGMKLPKYDEKCSLHKSGVTVTKSTARSVWVMLATCLSCLIIQIPAAMWSSLSEDKQAEYEHDPALVGLVLALLGFLGYCIYQLKSKHAEDIIRRRADEVRMRRWQHHFGKTFGRFDNVVTETFNSMDTDNSGTLDLEELSVGLKLLGLPVSDENPELIERVMESMDVDNDGEISLGEFRIAVKMWMDPKVQQTASQAKLPGLDQPINGRRSTVYLGVPEFVEPRGSKEADALEFVNVILQQDQQRPLLGDQPTIAYHEIEHEEESEKGPERYVFLKACAHIALGMAFVLIFSEHMVAILGNLADKLGVNPFYVSYIVAPLATNACEIVSALSYALAKTETKVSMAHASLYGVVCMNNTFCFAVFFLIMYKNNLQWKFTAETLCIVFSEIAIALLGYKRTIPVWKALVGLLVYPLAILFVIKYSVGTAN